MTRPRILFVDDEAYALDAVANVLRRERARWDLAFVTDGAAALRSLAAQPHDIVVTDLRMPGMDGARLLAQVRERHPDVVRVVWSGDSDREAVIRALPVAHQLLHKPSDPAVLRSVLERLCALREGLPDATLRGAAGHLEALPTVPSIYYALARTLLDPGCTVAQLVPVVESDPALVVRVLRLVNSAYFGLAQPVMTVLDAVKRLGLAHLRDLVLTAHVIGGPGTGDEPDPHLVALQARAVDAGRRARALLASDPARADQAYVAGVIAGVGRLVLATEGGASTRAVDHVAVGAYLLGLWGLPRALVDVVAAQRSPRAAASLDVAVLAAVHHVSAEGAVDRDYLRDVARITGHDALRTPSDLLSGVAL